MKLYRETRPGLDRSRLQKSHLRPGLRKPRRLSETRVRWLSAVSFGIVSPLLCQSPHRSRHVGNETSSLKTGAAIVTSSGLDLSAHLIVSTVGQRNKHDTTVHV